MTCAKCNLEFNPGVEICINCGISLTFNLENNLTLNKISWVKIGPVSGKIYIDMISQKLQNQNITHYLKANFITSALGIVSGNMIGSDVFIFVPKSFQKKTLSIINAITGG